MDTPVMDATRRERGFAQAVETQMRRWEMSRQVEARHRAQEAAADLERPLTVAISRECGARGAAIARNVAERLSWQVYDHELMAYMANQMHVRESLLDSLDEKTVGWSREWLNIVLDQEALDQESFIVHLTRVVLAIGLHGEAIIVGRGANFILPADRCVSVRIIAPLAERVAYISQRERLTTAEAQKRLRETDRDRSGFIEEYFHKDLADPHHYDLVLDSSALGEEASARLIVQAMEAKRSRVRESAKPGRPSYARADDSSSRSS
jgi:cytidylate kinase